MAQYDIVCTKCKHEQLNIIHSVHDPHPPCPICNAPTENLWRRVGGIGVDGIPGGYWVRHGVCWPDGTPRRFDSVSEIRKAAFEAGLTMGYETPKPNPRLVEMEQERREQKTKISYER